MPIPRSNSDTLVARVGDKIDLPITTASVPSIGQVKQWLQEGALRLAKLLPDIHLAGLFATATYPYNSSGIYPLDVEPLRINAIMVGASKAQIVPVGHLRNMKGLIAEFEAWYQGMAAITGSGGVEQVEIWPKKLNQALTIDYIASPAPESEWPDSPFSPPLAWEDALVEYAVAVSRIQDEEAGLAQLSMQEWERKVAEMAKTGVFGVSVEA